MMSSATDIVDRAKKKMEEVDAALSSTLASSAQEQIKRDRQVSKGGIHSIDSLNAVERREGGDGFGKSLGGDDPVDDGSNGHCDVSGDGTSQALGALATEAAVTQVEEADEHPQLHDSLHSAHQEATKDEDTELVGEGGNGPSVDVEAGVVLGDDGNQQALMRESSTCRADGDSLARELTVDEADSIENESNGGGSGTWANGGNCSTAGQTK